jgi:hypothetical protein
MQPGRLGVAIAVAIVGSVTLSMANAPASDPVRALAQSDRAGAAAPQYRALRRLEAGNTGSGKHAWMEVWTEFTPGDGFRYDVVAEGGADYVRKKVLRAVLEGESGLIAKGQPLRAPLVAANYHVSDGGRDSDGLWKILLKPARKAEGIVAGAVLLAPEDDSLVRIEGRLAKSPSFWVRDVDVTWRYAKVGGVVVPVELSSVARVHMFGRSSFRMVYQYVSVDGREVTPADVVARR